MNTVLLVICVLSFNVNIALVGYIFFSKTVEKKITSLEDTNKKLLMKLSQPQDAKLQRPLNRQSMASPLITMGATEEELARYKKLQTDEDLYYPSRPRRSAKGVDRDVRREN